MRHILHGLVQVMDPYISRRSNPLTDTLCWEGMVRASRLLLRIYHQGNNAWACVDIALIRLFGGLALVNAGLAAVHGFAAVLGGMFPAPYSVPCGRFLQYVMASNVPALQERLPGSGPLRRYEEIARILTRFSTPAAMDRILRVEQLCASLQVPSLASYGMMMADLPILIEKVSVGSSMQRNAIQLPREEMWEILAQAL